MPIRARREHTIGAGFDLAVEAGVSAIAAERLTAGQPALPARAGHSALADLGAGDRRASIGRAPSLLPPEPTAWRCAAGGR